MDLPIYTFSFTLCTLEKTLINCFYNTLITEPFHKAKDEKKMAEQTKITNYTTEW
jgi:hypothetical protein